MDAGENTNDEVEKAFTIVTIEQVQWARVTEHNLSVKIAGCTEPIYLSSDDETFEFYKNIFVEHRDAMLKDVPIAEQVETLKLQLAKAESLLPQV